MTNKGPDKVLRQMARAGPSWICYCCNWNYIWALFSIAGGETWGITLKTWSWENTPEGKLWVGGRTRTPQSRGWCIVHSWPWVRTDRVIPYSCKRWGGREAEEPSRPPGLIPLKTWAHLREQHLPVFCIMAPEASLPSPMSSWWPSNHTYHICWWMLFIY